jgi:plastocyanin
MATRYVIIVESGFLPQNITVTVGTTVNWLNEGPAQHTTTSDTGVWDSGTLNPGNIFQFTFNAAGTYPYHCALHPNMVGNVTVQPSTCTPTPAPTSTATPVPNTPIPTFTRTPTRTVTPTPTFGCAGGVRNVIIANNQFLPQVITITTGTTVNWLNEGPEQHTTTSDTGVWDSGTLNPGQTFQFAFHTPGTYPYHCAIHPGMVGSITVQQGACTPTPVSTATGTAPTATRTATATTPPAATSTRTPTLTPTPVSTAIPNTATSTPPIVSTSTSTPTTCAIQFTDVPPGHTFYTFVRCLACRGIISGYPCGGPGEPCDEDNTPYFRPNGSVTRGQIAKIVSEAAGFSEPPGAQQFEDVALGHTFFDWVWRLADRGIVSGYPCGGPGEPCGPGNLPYFRPNGNATRGQISKIVSEAAGFADPPGAQQFEDVLPGSTFFDFIYRLAARGIMNGYPCGGPGEPCGPGNLPYFRPASNATRGQLSKIAANTFFPECSPPRR